MRLQRPGTSLCWLQSVPHAYAPAPPAGGTARAAVGKILDRIRAGKRAHGDGQHLRAEQVLDCNLLCKPCSTCSAKPGQWRVGCTSATAAEACILPRAEMSMLSHADDCAALLMHAGPLPTCGNVDSTSASIWVKSSGSSAASAPTAQSMIDCLLWLCMSGMDFVQMVCTCSLSTSGR